MEEANYVNPRFKMRPQTAKLKSIGSIFMLNSTQFDTNSLITKVNRIAIQYVQQNRSKKNHRPLSTKMKQNISNGGRSNLTKTKLDREYRNEPGCSKFQLTLMLTSSNRNKWNSDKRIWNHELEPRTTTRTSNEHHRNSITLHAKITN